MPFELRIAVQHEPATDDSVTATRASFVSILVNGGFDDEGRVKVIETARSLFDEGADSVFIDLEDVTVSDTSCMQRLAVDVMNERAANHHLQVTVRDFELHKTCGSLPDARDWLIKYTRDDVVGGRRAIHVDSKRE